MNNPKRILKAVVLGVCCLILTPYASADGPPVEGLYNFVTVSTAGVVDSVLHILVMNGRGHFDADHVEVDGGGEFNHFDGNSGPPPLTILGSGTWKPTEFVSWNPVLVPGPNPYGQAISGTLTMGIRLFPDGSDDDNHIDGTLTVVCNVPPAGNFTGLPEGIMLEFGGLSFVPTGTGITFHTVGRRRHHRR